MYPSLLPGIDMPIAQEVENFSFNNKCGLTKGGYAPRSDSRGRLNVQQLCKYRRSISRTSKYRREPCIQQLLAHYHHFTPRIWRPFINNGAGIQRNDRPDPVIDPLLATLGTVPSSCSRTAEPDGNQPAATKIWVWNAIRGWNALESISLPNVERGSRQFLFRRKPETQGGRSSQSHLARNQGFRQMHRSDDPEELGATTAITLAADIHLPANVPAACLTVPQRCGRGALRQQPGCNGKPHLEIWLHLPTLPELGRQGRGSLLPRLKTQRLQRTRCHYLTIPT